MPEDRLVTQEVCERVQAVINQLPAGQRRIMQLRDVQGCTAEEVCRILGLSQVNQRVLLHRGRTRVRQALEDYFAE
jgi:RNA polymerase sigma-70 factor (ECF subfamily)